MELYRHSGDFSILGIVLASTIGMVSAIFLGIIYSFATVNIPVSKFHILLVLLFGLCIGWMAAWGAKAGKIRNCYMAMANGFFCGLIGLYVAWGTHYLTSVVIPNKMQINVLSAYSPSVVAVHLKFIYEKGIWPIDKGKVPGYVVIAFWSLEALIIVGISTFLAPYLIRHRPFCERCDCWTDIKLEIKNLSLSGAGENLKALLSGDLTSLKYFKPANNEPLSLELELATCPTCAETQCLTIYQVKKTLENKGKMKVKRTALVRNMLIDAADVPL